MLTACAVVCERVCMGLQWPEETERSPTRRRVTVLGHPTLTDELFESDPSEPKQRFAYWLPTLVVIVLLVGLGVFLAINGPLPTVFPRCGGCEMPGV
jgi:hypothetical protein